MHIESVKRHLRRFEAQDWRSARYGEAVFTSVGIPTPTSAANTKCAGSVRSYAVTICVCRRLGTPAATIASAATGTVPVVMELRDLCELIVDCEHKTAPTQEIGYPLRRITQRWARLFQRGWREQCLGRDLSPLDKMGCTGGWRFDHGTRAVRLRTSADHSQSRAFNGKP